MPVDRYSEFPSVPSNNTLPQAAGLLKQRVRGLPLTQAKNGHRHARIQSPQVRLPKPACVPATISCMIRLA
jgi:hypothetical protein